MKTSKELREEIGQLLDRVEAILAVAKDENREPTADELAEIDGIHGKGKDGSGQIAALEEQLARVERIEAKQAEYAQNRAAVNGGLKPQKGEEHEEPSKDKQDAAVRASRIIVPSNHRFRYGALKAYKGENAEQRAYIAGRFLLGTIFRDEKSAAWCREHGIDTTFRAALKESANELGGFLVPEEMEQSIIDLREEYGVFRRESKVTPMMSDTKTVPRRTGGVTAYFGGESPSSGMTESNKSWDQVRLVAKKVYVLTRYSNELAEDAIISIGDDLTNEIAYAFANKEDECGFNGDGTSTYGGIVGLKNALLAGSEVTAATGNTSFGTLDLSDFESMVGKLPQYAEGNAKWYVSKAGYAASMLRLIDAAGGNTISTLQSGDGRVREFLGYPVVISQVMNSTLTAQVSTEGLVYFGDLRMASTLGNRRGLSIKVSDDRYLEFDEIGIRGTERFDINVHEVGTATAAGAMIQLLTPAS